MKLDRMFSHWQPIRTDLTKTIDKFSDDELAYRPFESSWTVGEIMRHIAHAEAGWFQFVVARELDSWPARFDAADFPSKTSIKALLERTHQATLEMLATLRIADLEQTREFPGSGNRLALGWIIWHVLEHEIHHRAELSLILGMLGREGLDV